MTLKKPCAGLIDFAKNPTWPSVMGTVVEVPWNALQPQAAGPLNYDLIDRRLENLRSGGFAKIRFLSGRWSPQWLPDGRVTVEDGQGPITADSDCWWRGNVESAYHSVTRLLGKRYDADPRIRGFCASLSMTIYAEQFMRGGAATDRTWAYLTAAGLTPEIDLDSIVHGVDLACEAFPTTPIELALNPYGGPTDNADLASTEMVWNTCRNRHGDQIVLANNSIRTEPDGSPGPKGQYQQMYADMTKPKLGQTATLSRIGDTIKTLEWAVSQGWLSVELPGGYEGVVTDAQLAPIAAALAANV